MTLKRTPTPQTGKNSYFYEFYVVFSNTETLPRLWRYFTRDKFEHCSVFMALGDKTVQIEQSIFGVRCHFFDVEVSEFMDFLAKEDNCTVVYLPRAIIKPYKNTLGTLVPSCVSLCQRITGLTCGSITPYSYYKFLIKKGGQQIE